MNYKKEKWSEFYGSKEYEANWEQTFRNKEYERKKEERKHYKECKINYGGSCDCGLIDRADKDSVKNCSNCEHCVDNGRWPHKIFCSKTGNYYVSWFYCERNYEVKSTGKERGNGD